MTACFQSMWGMEGIACIRSGNAPTGNLSHLKPYVWPETEILKQLCVGGKITASQTRLLRHNMCVCEWYCVQCIWKCLFITPSLSCVVYDRSSSVCFGPMFFKSPACVCVHANVVHRGLCPCLSVCVALTLTVIHSFVAWHPDRGSAWEGQRLRETVRTLHSDSMLAVCLAQIRSTLMNIQQFTITARISYIFTKVRDESWYSPPHCPKEKLLLQDLHWKINQLFRMFWSDEK